MIDVSVVICTRNRAVSLRETLESLARVSVPGNTRHEIVIVDNASDDDTRRLVEDAQRLNDSIRYVHEGRPGLSHARNAGLRAVRGDIILFTDDDVRLPADWIGEMCGPIWSGQGQAVAGGVRIAPHLLRDWMQPLHRAWLASTDWIDPENPQRMVGANMAFSREVLSQVPCFDPELGAGTPRHGEETFFSRQLLERGFRIAPALGTQVEHHFEPSRLLTSSFVDSAKKHGRGDAYVARFWGSQDRHMLRLRALRKRVQWNLWRAAHPQERHRREGLSLFEMDSVRRLYYYTSLISEPGAPA